MPEYTAIIIICLTFTAVALYFNYKVIRIAREAELFRTAYNVAQDDIRRLVNIIKEIKDGETTP